MALRTLRLLPIVLAEHVLHKKAQSSHNCMCFYRIRTAVLTHFPILLTVFVFIKVGGLK